MNSYSKRFLGFLIAVNLLVIILLIALAVLIDIHMLRFHPFIIRLILIPILILVVAVNDFIIFRRVNYSLRKSQEEKLEFDYEELKILKALKVLTKRDEKNKCKENSLQGNQKSISIEPNKKEDRLFRLLERLHGERNLEFQIYSSREQALWLSWTVCLSGAILSMAATPPNLHLIRVGVPIISCIFALIISCRRREDLDVSYDALNNRHKWLVALTSNSEKLANKLKEPRFDTENTMSDLEDVLEPLSFDYRIVKKEPSFSISQVFQTGMDKEIIADLDKESIPKKIQCGFRKDHCKVGSIELTLEDKPFIEKKGYEWYVRKGQNLYNIKNEYKLTSEGKITHEKKEDKTISISRKLQNDLDKGKKLHRLRKEFKKNGIKLNSKAKISTVTKGFEWRIEDEAISYIINHELNVYATFAIFDSPHAHGFHYSSQAPLITLAVWIPLIYISIGAVLILLDC